MAARSAAESRQRRTAGGETVNQPPEVFAVEQSKPGVRLDVFLRARFPEKSRGTLQRLIEEGHIRVNDRAVKPTHPPRAGEIISIVWPEAKPAEAQPEDIPLNILFEDKDQIGRAHV